MNAIEWISVNEKLPFVNDDILYVVDGIIEYGYLHSNGIFYGYKPGAIMAASPRFMQRGSYNFSVATHWAFLPEAPQ